MGNTFSNCKPSHKPSPRHEPSQQDRAILDLKAARDRLKKYQTRMELEAGKIQTQAVALLKSGKKDRALLCVKMKRLRETKVGEINTQLINLEEMIQTIEWETQSLKVFDALKAGNAALEGIHSIMSIESVEQLMEDTAEAIEYQNEISTLIAGENLEISDEDLEAELFELTQADGVNLAAAMPEVPVMPVAPTGAPIVASSEQQAEEEAGLVAA